MDNSGENEVDELPHDVRCIVLLGCLVLLLLGGVSYADSHWGRADRRSTTPDAYTYEPVTSPTIQTLSGDTPYTTSTVIATTTTVRRHVLITTTTVTTTTTVDQFARRQCEGYAPAGQDPGALLLCRNIGYR